MRLPRSAWALGLVCLAGQVLALAERGPSHADGTWVVLSMVLTALVVGWVSAGVLRARTGRLVAITVGMLGGLTAAPDDAAGTTLRVGL